MNQYGGETLPQTKEKTMKCLCCKKEIFLHPFLNGGKYPTEEEKMKSGVVYSEAGYREVQISGICEACFDRITKDTDEDDED